MLAARWWQQQRPRPTHHAQVDYQYIAAVGDVISLEVFRPKGRFEEAKAYWDAKNGIYALKKEVHVSATAPHIALFSAPAEIGSVHDYSIFRKTPQERNALEIDAHNSWGVLYDSAYTGPETDTPGLRRIHLFRIPSTAEERQRNLILARMRVVVEQFV